MHDLKCIFDQFAQQTDAVYEYSSVLIATAIEVPGDELPRQGQQLRSENINNVKAGLQTALYTPNTQEAVAASCRLAVDVIITDYPDLGNCTAGSN